MPDANTDETALTVLLDTPYMLVDFSWSLWVAGHFAGLTDYRKQLKHVVRACGESPVIIWDLRRAGHDEIDYEHRTSGWFQKVFRVFLLQNERQMEREFDSVLTTSESPARTLTVRRAIKLF